MTETASRPDRVLVVDDEPSIVELLCAALRLAGYEVASADSGRRALRVAAEYRPDLLVLDVMLPDLDGYEVARRLRAAGEAVPVVFLTARDATADKIMGLTVGGDDYVTKPFSLEEVALRIRAVLRRTRGAAVRSDTTLRCAGLELDEDSHQVHRDGEPVTLSPTEFKLLRYLLMNAGRVVSKAQILDHVWRYDFGGDARIVESYISLLRRKVDQAEPALIQTVRGVGYTLRPPRP
jgi:two-component system OmpR family response regulator